MGGRPRLSSPRYIRNPPPPISTLFLLPLPIFLTPSLNFPAPNIWEILPVCLTCLPGLPSTLVSYHVRLEERAGDWGGVVVDGTREPPPPLRACVGAAAAPASVGKDAPSPPPRLGW